MEVQLFKEERRPKFFIVGIFLAENNVEKVNDSVSVGFVNDHLQLPHLLPQSCPQLILDYPCHHLQEEDDDEGRVFEPSANETKEANVDASRVDELSELKVGEGGVNVEVLKEEVLQFNGERGDTHLL